MTNKLVYIFTVGCQMNSYDSGQIKGLLFSSGYLETKKVEDADLVIVNTCTIRFKAEQKAFSFIGRIAKLKDKDPSVILAVGGCVAQQYGSKIFKRMPFVDIVFGTNAIYRLPELLYRVQSLGHKIVDVDSFDVEIGLNPIFSTKQNERKVSVFVTIMRGCNNFCTYCVVPYVRGKEISRNPESIISEIKILVASGVKEVVLLGQNVNSYGSKDKLVNFVQLLKKINKIRDLKRIRFTTSNPDDLSTDLINSFHLMDKLCKHIHLPVQSGNNTVLRRMKRKYNIEDYISKVAKLRSKCKNISITSDFIVGFPGESDRQFNDTLDLIKLIRFDNSFAFSYSDRPSTVAYNFQNKIAKKVKKNRLRKLLELQNKITKEANCSYVGKTEKILVEKLSNMQSFDRNLIFNSQNCSCSGRTSTNKIVHIKIGSEANFLKLKGNIVNVRITEAKSHSLRGELLN